MIILQFLLRTMAIVTSILFIFIYVIVVWQNKNKLIKKKNKMANLVVLLVRVSVFDIGNCGLWLAPILFCPRVFDHNP